MPAMLLWALLLLLAVPALALAETEAPPSDGVALIDETAPLDQYGTILPSGEEEIQFEPAPVVPATSETVDPAPVTPAPVDPVTDPVPTDPIPTDPVGEEPVPTDPVGEEPVGETPVEEPPVGSVIDNSPEQAPVSAPVYTPPVVVFPPVDIPVAAVDPLPSEVIPADLARQVEAPPAEAAVPPPSTAAPIARPSGAVSGPATIPSPVFSPARPTAVAPEPENPFATGADPFTRSVRVAPATLKEPESAGLPGTGVDKNEVYTNPFLTKIVSVGGPAPSGSQFFEVLATYVMAGGSGPPTGVALILLVQLCTVVAAFAWRTPRSMFQTLMGASDKLFVGYRAVALRPG